MIRAEGMLNAFERVGWGALLIDADGRMISLNDEARRHVGSRIKIAQGRIVATHRTANVELEHRIAATLSADNGTLLAMQGGVLLPRPEGRPVMAYVISVAESGGDSPQQAKAIVVLIDSAKPSEPTEDILREGFGLTPAETRVAIGFARGCDLHEIARDQGLSIETVRKSFKAVLAKTNTSRQAELAILLARLAQRPGSSVRTRAVKPAAPSITYAEWRERAREKLAGPSTLREKAWVNAFIIGKTPDEAAALAETYAYNRSIPAKRR